MDGGLQSSLLSSSQSRKNDNDLKSRIWVESQKIWRVAFPAMLTRITSFGILVVTQAFIGQINAVELAAYALVQSISIRFANGIILGMSSATETLCGQAYGAKQNHMLGVYLQRSWIVDLVVATLLLPLLIFATSIYKLLGEEDDISEAAGTISYWFIPFLYYNVFNMTVQMYLQAQQKNNIVGWVSPIAFVLHVLLSWIFVYVFDWGVNGAMAAMNVSVWSTMIVLFAYIFGGWCPETWKGFSKAAFVDIWPVIKLSISSGIMLCLELWYTSVLVLLAGYTSTAAITISAFSICINISTWELMACLGFLAAACVRVGNEIGRGDTEAAKFSIKVQLSTSTAFGVVFWILCLVFGKEIPYLFTSSDEVAEAAANLSVLLAFTMLLNGVQPVLSGVAIGIGAQRKVAVVNVCSYYLIGVPLGVLLGYVFDLGVQGIWIGLLVGLLTQTLVLLYITWRTDWEDEVNKSTRRLNQFYLKPDETEEQNAALAQP